MSNQIQVETLESKLIKAMKSVKGLANDGIVYVTLQEGKINADGYFRKRMRRKNHTVEEYIGNRHILTQPERRLLLKILMVVQYDGSRVSDLYESWLHENISR